jgi:osmotically-inducible protein OsmY
MTKLASLVGTGLLAASIACSVGGPDVEEQANEALDGANLDAVDANYDASERVIHVTGTVATESDRQRAGDIVEQAVNNGARVANEVTVAGGNEEIADDLDGGIETRLENRVELDPTLKDHSISFDANNGVVTITGNVPTAGDTERIETMARSEAGVRDVANALEVGAAGSR